MLGLKRLFLSPVNEYFQFITRWNSQNINSRIVQNFTKTLIYISPPCSFYFLFLLFLLIYLFNFIPFVLFYFIFLYFNYFIFTTQFSRNFSIACGKSYLTIPHLFSTDLNRNLSSEFDLFYKLSSPISKCIKTKKKLGQLLRTRNCNCTNLLNQSIKFPSIKQHFSHCPCFSLYVLHLFLYSYLNPSTPYC